MPTLSVYEVFKRILQQRGEGDALQVIALALRAARLSIDLQLPMADGVMRATARAFDATLWTQDVGRAKS